MLASGGGRAEVGRRILKVKRMMRLQHEMRSELAQGCEGFLLGFGGDRAAAQVSAVAKGAWDRGAKGCRATLKGRLCLLKTRVGKLPSFLGPGAGRVPCSKA